MAVSEDMLQKKSCSCQKWRVQFLSWNIATFTLLIEQNKRSVKLTCLIFIIFILGFESSILHKLKNTVNCRLKLNSETRSSHQAWSATLLKKRLWHRCFPVNFAKFLRIPFLQNTSWRLLLWQCYSCSTVRILRYKFYELLTLFHSEIHCWRIIICTRNMTHDPKNIIIGLFWLLTLLVVSEYNFLIYKNK